MSGLRVIDHFEVQPVLWTEGWDADMLSDVCRQHDKQTGHYQTYLNGIWWIVCYLTTLYQLQKDI
jgi:hypothetical protein